MFYCCNDIERRHDYSVVDPILLKKGTYRILNHVNKKFYVGSTSESFIARFKSHIERLLKGKHLNPHMQAAFNKYGKENFYFNILETIEEDQQIKKKEQELLDTFAGLVCCYNISRDASAPMRGRKHTEEALKKMSDFSKSRVKEIGEITRRCRTGTKHLKKTIEKMKIAARNRDDSKRIVSLKSKEFREKQSILHKGVKRNEKWQAKMLTIVKSPEYRQKMSEVKKGIKPSEETRIKMSLARGSKKYTFVKDGIQHEVINFRKFSEEYRLDRKILRSMVKDQFPKEYKGWTLLEDINVNNMQAHI